MTNSEGFFHYASHFFAGTLGALRFNEKNLCDTAPCIVVTKNGISRIIVLHCRVVSRDMRKIDYGSGINLLQGAA